MEVLTRKPHVSPYLEIKLDQSIINYLWKIIRKSQTENIDYKNKLAGNISKSYLIKDIDSFFFKSVCNPLIKHFRKNNLGKDPDSINISLKDPDLVKINLSGFWVNYQYKTEFNPYHDHNGIYSFAIWMKIPYDWDDQKKLAQFSDIADKHIRVGTFEFEYIDSLGGVKNIGYRLSPKLEGTMLFFPSKLRHCVYPFYETEEPRISIAGNLSWTLV